MLPLPNVASVVVSEAGALQRTEGCAGPSHSDMRCQGGLWVCVHLLVVVFLVPIFFLFCEVALCDAKSVLSLKCL